MITFLLVPNLGALPIEIGATEDQVKSILGEPDIRSTAFRGERVHYYAGCNVGYDSNGRVVHIGFWPGCQVRYGDLDGFSDAAFERMLKDDGAPMEVVGAIILLNLGISLTGFHDGDVAQKAISMFVKGEHDSLLPKMKPFTWKRT